MGVTSEVSFRQGGRCRVRGRQARAPGTGAPPKRGGAGAFSEREDMEVARSRGGGRDRRDGKALRAGGRVLRAEQPGARNGPCRAERPGAQPSSPFAPSRDLRPFAFRRRRAIAFNAVCVAGRLDAVGPTPSANAKTQRSREEAEAAGTAGMGRRFARVDACSARNGPARNLLSPPAPLCSLCGLCVRAAGRRPCGADTKKSKARRESQSRAAPPLSHTEARRCGGGPIGPMGPMRPIPVLDPPRPITGRTGQIGSWMRTGGTRATNGTKGTARMCGRCRCRPDPVRTAGTGRSAGSVRGTGRRGNIPPAKTPRRRPPPVP